MSRKLLFLSKRGGICLLHLRLGRHQRHRCVRPWQRPTRVELESHERYHREDGRYEEEEREEDETRRVPAHLQSVQEGQGTGMLRGLPRVFEAVR